VGVNPFFGGKKSIKTYFAHHVNEDLGMISRETLNLLGPIMVREDGRNQTDALVRGKAMADQLFPVSMVTTHEDTVKLTDM